MEQLTKGERILVYGVITILFLLIIITVSFNYAMKNLTEDKLIERVMENSNYDYSWLDKLSNEKYNQSVYDLSMAEFLVFIVDNYKYERYTKDCKYWSYFYKMWFEANGYEVNYVLLDTHIFVVASKQGEYWVADGLNIRKTEIGFEL